MGLRKLAHLYRIRLRSRWVPELLALAGIAVGVALVFAALVASTSLTGSVRQLTDGLVGDATLQIAARGSNGFDQRLLAKVQRGSGVRWAAPVLEVNANLVGPRGLRSVVLVGGDPRSARFGGELLRRLAVAKPKSRPGLALPAPVAAKLGVASGAKVRVETGSGISRVPVTRILEEEDVGPVVHSPVALASLPLAQEVSAMRGRVSRIFVAADAGRDRQVERHLDRLASNRLNVGPADTEVRMFERASYPTNRSTALFSVLSALVGFLFALSAMLLTVPQRRRLIAALRLAGYDPWVVVEVLMFDALVLGVTGSLLGLTLGDQASRQLFDEVPGYLTSAFAVGSQRIVTLESVAIAAGAGTLAACVAVLVPVRDALSLNPLRPMAITAASGREAWSTGGGIALLGMAVIVAVVAPEATLLAVGPLTLALLLTLPSFLRLSVSAFARVGRRMKSPIPILAVLELSSGTARIRTLAVTATGAIAVFATVAIGGAQADLQRGLDAAVRAVNESSDVWVTVRGTSNTLGTISFTVPPERIAAARRVPGVRDVRRYGGALLDVGDYRAWVMASPASVAHPVPASQVRDGDVAGADRRVRSGGWVALSERIGEQEGAGVGERAEIAAPLPIGLRVAALSTNVGWPGGAIVMSGADYARAWGTDAVGALGVEVARDASPARVARGVERVLGSHLPLRAETRAERMDRQFTASRSGLMRLSQISAMVLIAAVLATAAAMGGMLWQRRPTLAALKLDGFGELELWRSLLLECGLLLGSGCVIGATFGLLGQILLDRALEAITGFPVTYVIAGPTAVGILALVTGIAVAILAVPGWLAVRVRPMADAPS